jgi:thiamine biosynthesis lipoprotein
LVDPSVGATRAGWGYDRDFAALAADGPIGAPAPAPGWWRVIGDRQAGTVLVSRGIGLDLGATAKAWTADQAARRIAERFGRGALVSLGGDVAVAGPATEGGWRVHLGDEHTGPGPAGQIVTITEGGLATSGLARRRWRRGRMSVHHIIDPRTGWPAAPGWRTVSVAAGDCVDANAASTAAIVRGAAAPGWLARSGLPARLVGSDGAVHTVAGWPTGDADGVR